MSEKVDALPVLRLEDWEPTKDTLHLYAQIVGKIRLASTPLSNHWWNVPLYVTVRGLTTRRIRQDGVSFTREMFASAVDQVIALRIRADRDGAVNLRASFETPMPAGLRVQGDTLILSGTNTSQEGLPAALRFEARVRLMASGGELLSSNDAITLRGVNSAMLLVAMGTNYRRFDDVGGDPAASTRRQPSGWR